MVKNKGNKMINGIDMLIDEQYKRDKKKRELEVSQNKILKLYNMIVEKLSLKDWNELKEFVDRAFEEEKEKLTITSDELIDVISYDDLRSRI